MEALTHLVGLLAQTDALWEPVRAWSNPSRVAAIVHAQSRFTRRGLRIVGGGGADDDRKQFERDLDEIEDTGLATFHRTRGRRSHWRLTDSADWVLRRIATGSDWPQMITCLAAIDVHEQSPRLRPPCNAVSENWLVGAEHGDLSRKTELRLMHLEEALAAALCRQLVTASSDHTGTVAYSLTDEGRAVLRDPAPPAVTWPEYSPQAHEVYHSAFVAARQAPTEIIPSPSLCVVPLSTGNWPERKEGANLAPLFNPS